MAKEKRQKEKQYNGQWKKKKLQTVYQPMENDKSTNNIMVKGKRQKEKQYNGQRKMTKGQTI